MAAVSLINVSKHIKPHSILNEINLSIEKGEFMAVVGPSGCGKSTLLRLVAGLDSVSSGEILINNQCVNKTPASKRDMAMVFQSYALYPHMTVFDNMAYGLKMRRLKKQEIFKRVEEAAEMLQLKEFLCRKPKELSGGQRQRVAMGRAIVRSPAVFLFDEPLSNLDAKLRTEMRHEIKKLHQQLKTTCLYVTHDQTEAMTMADRIVILNKGYIEQVGTPQEIYQKPASVFVAGFTGHYPMNFFPARLCAQGKNIGTSIGLSYTLSSRSDEISLAQELLMAVRPEHWLVKSDEDKNCIKAKIKYIDDMGADKLVQATDLCQGIDVTIRVPADWKFQDEFIYIGLPDKKVHLFDLKTGERVGD